MGAGALIVDVPGLGIVPLGAAPLVGPGVGLAGALEVGLAAGAP